MKHIHTFENFLNERSDGGWVGTQIYRKEDKKEFTKERNRTKKYFSQICQTHNHTFLL